MSRIITASRDLRDEWLRQRHALWPDEAVEDLRPDIDAWFEGRARHLQEVLFAVDDRGRLLGFAELNVRAYAEGCSSDRIAFLEGWYVEPYARGRGIGAALVAAAERWARAAGCTEFASDALADNRLGAAAHLGVGFEEVETIRCFRKDLRPESAFRQAIEPGFAPE